MSLLFEPPSLCQITLPNRIAVSPMCQYSAQEGLANDQHLVHLGSRVMGGAGLVIVEVTAALLEGRITADDLGIWSDARVELLYRITRFIESQGTVARVQLAHAGRKASIRRPWLGKHGSVSIGEDGWMPMAPSAIPFDPQHMTPEALSEVQIEALVQVFARAAEHPLAVGFKITKVHTVHGYLLHQFLSPLSNQYRDQYGGCFENRVCPLLQVTTAVRKAWPEELPLFVRLSATDWVEDGWNPDETVELARRLKDLGADLVDMSSGGIVANTEILVGPGYQAEFTERAKKEAGIVSSMVGIATELVQAEHILRTGQVDLVLLVRELLRDPYWPLHAADELCNEQMSWPPQYLQAAHRNTPPRKSLEVQ